MSAVLLPASLPVPSPYREVVIILALALLIFEARRVLPAAAGRATRGAGEEAARPGAGAAGSAGPEQKPLPGEILRIRTDDAPTWGDTDAGVIHRARNGSGRTVLVLLAAAVVVAVVLIALRDRRRAEGDEALGDRT